MSKTYTATRNADGTWTLRDYSGRNVHTMTTLAACERIAANRYGARVVAA